MAVEFRGCKNLVFAEVTNDDNETTGSNKGYVTGTVKVLAPVAEISKTVETSSEAKYYDDVAAIIINSEGSDTVTFTCAIPSDEVLAEICGRVYDTTSKKYIEAPRKNKYFAVGYILGETGEGDDERFVWRYKGTFNIPDETSATKNDGTDSNNISLEFTGIFTEHKFTNGGGTGIAAPAKAMFIRKSDDVATEAQFFAQVATPDTTFTG
jgi:phi13 family phage major tail protein